MSINTNLCPNCGSIVTTIYEDQQVLRMELQTYDILSCYDCGFEEAIGEQVDVL